MEIDRRSLMKGLLAGGALLALGTSPWAFADPPIRNSRRCLLFLGDSAMDDAFEKGVRAACGEMKYHGLQTVKVNGGLLSDPGQVAGLLEQSRGARWIAVMDDASAAVFQELARSAGGRLLSVGSHASVNDEVCPIRHVWLAASPAQSAGGLLAAQFIEQGAGFSITENFLSESTAAGDLVGWSAPGFSSYRSAGPEAIHLHCSGLSLAEGCGLLSSTEAEGWTPIPRQACQHERVSRQSNDWAESVGWAVAASALGVNQVQESCSGRAFVYRPSSGQRKQPTDRFVTFVMDL